ncbi:MAG: UPF0158 family protein [Chlamydiae bacterium]|nr:UPF0158 family protein [Chlamydiota bacterium]
MRYPKLQQPLILRYHRLLEAFSKSDDERDFYLDRVEGFLIYLDLDKNQSDLDVAEKEIEDNAERYSAVPKLTYYETKKFMEGFVNEKVYDIDAKEKLLDIIGAKEARENFLEFIYDHLSELDKWQQYYHERSRVRIIEWLRQCEIFFVFEEDIELSKNVVERLKEHKFDAKVSKELQNGREALVMKANTYYSNEALNPRPKRGRPPKQVAKVELEPQLTDDIYTTVPASLRHFLFCPEYSSSAVSFSAKFDNEAQFLASMKGTPKMKIDTKLEVLSQRLESLRHISQRVKDVDEVRSYEPSIHRAMQTAMDDKEVSTVSEGGSKVAKLFEGALPKKRGRPSKGEEQPRPKVKQVAPIQYKTNKKK